MVGYAGEKVDVRFVERTRLSEGKVMLYRRPGTSTGRSLRTRYRCRSTSSPPRRSRVPRSLSVQPREWPDQRHPQSRLACDPGAARRASRRREWTRSLRPYHRASPERADSLRCSVGTGEGGRRGRLACRLRGSGGGPGALVHGLSAREAKRIVSTRAWLEGAAYAPAACSALRAIRWRWRSGSV